MKVLAAIRVSAAASRDEVMARLDEELRGSWQLFCAGVLREAYCTDDPAQVVFIMEAVSLQAAAEALQSLPLVANGSFTVSLTALLPFSNWARLFSDHPGTERSVEARNSTGKT